ncbi:hypothetical protein CDL12_14629 [Handroanthus impetiginosus]|uniref:Petal formation-expressed n=1 Tax=Handroanthus impetiginosus TaxID=429701 RepID=A0A2G9H5J9_9LAMI|nr:hypothetical protein CDL12_14629 [Handroanthus impetiginosus]
MATLKASSLVFNSSLSSSSSKHRGNNVKAAAINIPKRLANISLPGLRIGGSVEDMELHKCTEKQSSPVRININEAETMVMAKLYAILEAVSDRVEMHKNVEDHLLLTSINSVTLAAATMAGIAAISSGAPTAALKLSSTTMYVAATGMLSIMNKIQPSQLAEEQRNAVRLFKQIESQIRTIISVGNPTVVDVKEMMEKVLALDKAYPLPLLGTMLDKFPADVEPAVWWPEQRRKQNKGNNGYNGWNGKMEEEMREIINVIRVKDKEDYLRLGKKALNLNKFLATTGPLLTGLAAVGSALVGSPTHGGWAVVLGVAGGALASVVNSFEHGGQVGMVFEMYRSNAGFFKMMEESIEWNLREEDLERRENGEVFEMKVGLQLGRSLSELRNLAAEAAVKGEAIDEFASKLF